MICIERDLRMSAGNRTSTPGLLKGTSRTTSDRLSRLITRYNYFGLTGEVNSHQ